MPTPWRKLLYKELKEITLIGKIIDLGGSKKSGYHELIKGDHIIEVANIDDEYGYDIKIDLEKKFSIPDSQYNSVLAINVLEHIYDYKNFLSESHRILIDNGLMIIGVPFLIQIHPCPHDYWRYSKETLVKVMTEAGFKDIEIKSIGRGPFTSACQIIYNVLFFNILRSSAYLSARYLDSLIQKNFSKDSYPLGYFIIAKK